jgi:hypothetical protein
MAEGSAVLVGAIADATYGPMLTMRPGGDEAEAGRAAFVPCPLTPAQAIAFVRERSASCGLDPARDDLAATARAVAAVARAMHDLRGRLVSLEANPLLVGRRGAVAVDALAEASGPA